MNNTVERTVFSVVQNSNISGRYITMMNGVYIWQF